jgi:pimeloyl-ACP methyl ester carboxylesterase
MTIQSLFPSPIEYTIIDGLEIRYSRARRAGAETILLLSPMPESIYAFLPIWSALSAKYDLLAVDLPGFGKSQGRPEVIAPEAMGTFIAGLVSHFELERPHAVGPDIGTSSLLFAAANNPGIFRTVTIGSGGASFPLEVESTLKDLIEAPSIDAFRDLDVAGLIDTVLSSLKTYSVPETVRRDYIESYEGGRFAECTRLVRRYPDELPILKERLSEVTIPVLIIAGLQDPYVPVTNAEYLERMLPHGRLAVVNTGHLVWEDEAETYALLVLDFVAGGEI